MATTGSYDTRKGSRTPLESNYYASDEDEDDVELVEQPGRSTLGRIVRAFGTNLNPSMGRLDDVAMPVLGHTVGGPRKRRPLEIRRLRRSSISRLLKRALWTLPMFILVTFGVLHNLEFLFGRARMLWNFNSYDPSLADWTKPGFLGADLRSYTTRDITPIPCHSHNDYSRRVPLYDAISWGCTSVEADVWHFDGELYVGHMAAALDQDRTFEHLYVRPLVDLLDRRGSASPIPTVTAQGIFESKPDQTLVLLVDFKTAGAETFEVVHKQLQLLRDKNYLSYWDGEKVVPRAVTVVASGEAPLDKIVETQQYRDIFYDAPLHALWLPPRSPIPHSDALHSEDGRMDYGKAMSLPEDNETSDDSVEAGIGMTWDPESYNTNTSYYASADFFSEVGFVWRGHMSPRQMVIIRGQIRGAKRRGLRVRYFNTPSWPTALRNHVWHVLVREGADILNVDDLKAAATFNWQAKVHDWWFW